MLQRINGCWFIHLFARHDPMEVIDTQVLPASSANEEERRFPVYRYQRARLPTRYKVVTRQVGKRELRKLKEIIEK